MLADAVFPNVDREVLQYAYDRSHAEHAECVHPKFRESHVRAHCAELLAPFAAPAEFFDVCRPSAPEPFDFSHTYDVAASLHDFIVSELSAVHSPLNPRAHTLSPELQKIIIDLRLIVDRLSGATDGAFIMLEQSEPA